jgi:hypothetical protein
MSNENVNAMHSLTNVDQLKKENERKMGADLLDKKVSDDE